MLQERELVHGNFTNNAKCALVIGSTLQETADKSGARMGARRAMALNQIALKLARIVSHPDGPATDEHWRDIEGYCRLARAEPIGNGADPGPQPQDRAVEEHIDRAVSGEAAPTAPERREDQ